ncbi:hypothetical protein ACRAWD_05335 [Caulobacter segnis]
MAAIHLDEVDRKIADLTALRLELARLLDQCRQDKISECLILESTGARRPGDVTILAPDRLTL